MIYLSVTHNIFSGEAVVFRGLGVQLIDPATGEYMEVYSSQETELTREIFNNCQACIDAGWVEVSGI